MQTETPILSEQEWRLVIELLHHEQDSLPGEIHHTDSLAYREQIEQRLRQVSTLLQRLELAIAQPAA